MVARIRDVDVVARVDRYTGRYVELAIAATEGSPGRDEVQVLVELLDSPEAGSVDDVHIVEGVDRYPKRITERARRPSRSVELCDVVEVRVELFDPGAGGVDDPHV